MESFVGQSLPLTNDLTPTQIRMFYGVALGLSDADIAQIYGLSTQTVKTHISNGLHNLCARNRAQAMTMLFRRGVFTPEMFPEHKH